MVMLKLDGKRLYLAYGCTDMRESISGLSLIVESSFYLNPLDRAWLVFYYVRSLVDLDSSPTSSNGRECTHIALLTQLPNRVFSDIALQ